jgi:hypothetical protein
MSNIVIRQNDLFLGEDWKAVYSAFSNISFKTYSFDSIKQSLVEYIRINYPEDFNDWSNSSEFVMMIDLLAYLGESLAFRVDLNARDNFIDTAERRESILRLAKMISYTPKRNIAASGKLKIKSIRTTQPIVDVTGKSLQNKFIIWNDPQNPDWYDQFILVLNSVFASSNPFGKPSKAMNRDGTLMQLYRVSSPRRSAIVENFSAIVAGENMGFEVVNPDFDTSGSLFERMPNPDEAKNIIYMSDGAGNSSPNTGFFLFFKQGKLSFDNYNFDKAIENRTVELPTNNINNDDVWVSQINENGAVVSNWEKVSSLDSIVYNDLDRNIRNIFSVQSLENDQIRIRFSDGKFGSVPKGLFRIWKRVSNGLEYTINPQEIRNKSINYDYVKNSGTDSDLRYSLTINFDLFDTIRNSSASETNDDIKERAPRVYYTQNRMTSGEDYNSFPLSSGGRIKKIKAVNRVYSGQSPYFNNYDPTKKYSSTVEFGDDGLIYKEFYKKTVAETLPTIKSEKEIIDSNIFPLLRDKNLLTFFLDKNQPTPVSPTNDITIDQGGWVWNRITASTTTSSGFLSTPQNSDSIILNASAPTPANLFTIGAYVLFEELRPVSYDPTFVPQQKWTNILALTSDGVYDSEEIGPVVVDENIPNGWRIVKIIPALRQTFRTSETEAISAELSNQNTFGLRYDISQRTWRIIDELNVSSENSDYSTAFAGDSSDANRDSSWLIRVQYTNNEYRFTVRLMRYVFESENISRFFFNENFVGVNTILSNVSRSKIKILGLNEDLATGKLFKKEFTFSFNNSIRYYDGYIDPRKIEIVPDDADLDGNFDIPDMFNIVTNNYGTDLKQSTIYFVKKLDELGFEFFEPTEKILVSDTLGQLNFYDWRNNPDGYIAGFVFGTKRFYVYNPQTTTLNESFNFTYKTGRNNLNYKYMHMASENSRIDPAITNVIDMYALTKTYDTIVREWKASDRADLFPVPETSQQLQADFTGLNDFKMISDQIIWNPAQFRLLFGTEALVENQAIFKIVKVENSNWTDNQIKQGVINAIDEYFNLDNWSFGDSIFTSELVAYVHQKLISHVASITIVPKQITDDVSEIYQIRMEFNELPLSVATVNDVVIIPSASRNNVRN